MLADWLFWGIAALVVAGCLAVVFAPLLRGGPAAARRASYDLQVHRDQLRELEADLARGVVTPAEAEATRTEVARRLLAAAEAERGETAAKPAPRRVTRAAAAGLMLVAGGTAIGLYAGLGAPGLRDQPLAARQAREAAARAERPGQAEAEAMVAANAPQPPPLAGEEAELVARLERVLEGRPQDVEGHRLLARSLASLGRWPEARAAQERVVEVLGDRATAADLVDLAEARILAAGGYVSPEAEAALARALALDPADPVGRYYSGLTLLQAGRPDLAHRVWSRLLAEAPPDAPWIEPLRAGVAEAARLAGLATPGPGAADVGAAGEMAAEDRQAMIEGMVGGLAERLASQGGPPEDWAQLIRSLGVLGRRDQAGRVLAEARDAYAGDAAALATIEAAARDAGLPR